MVQNSATPHVGLPPRVITRVNSQQGKLNFLSTFTAFGRPQDVTVTSLRIEHLIPADPHTWHTLRRAYEQASQSRVPPLSEPAWPHRLPP